MSEDNCTVACERNDSGHCTQWARVYSCQRWRDSEEGRAFYAKTLAPESVESVKQVMADTTTALSPLGPTPSTTSRAKELAEAHWFGYVKPLILAHGAGDVVTQLVEFHYISAFVHGMKHGVEDSR